MSVSGHRTEKSFRTYIKATGEEHAQIMKKHWDNNTKRDENNEIETQ